MGIVVVAWFWYVKYESKSRYASTFTTKAGGALDYSMKSLSVLR